MASYTSSLGLELITPGSQAGLWGNTTNNSLNLIDQAITGVTPLSFASASGTTQVLTDYNGAEDQARAAVLNITGTATGPNTVVIPNKQKTYLVRNGTGQDIVFQTGTPSASYTVGAGYSILIFCDGNNNVFTGIAAPSVGTLLVNAGGTGTTTFGGGGFVKSSGGTNALTASPTVSLASEVSGTLSVSNGGTGKTSLAAGALLFGNGTGAVGEFVGGSAGQVATWNGTGWTAASPSTGVSSVSSTTIGVSPTSGNVVITLTGSNVTTALGTTPVQYATNVAASGTIASSVTATTQSTTDNSTLVATTAYVKNNLANYITTTGTAADSSALGGVAASGYATLANTQTFTGQKTFAGSLVSTTYNFAGSVSIFYNSGPAVVAIANGSANYVFNNSGTATAVSWTNTSDARLKENVEKLSSGLSTVAALNPVKFSFKKDKLTAPNHYGFIAQELEQIVPEVVAVCGLEQEGIADMKSVAYSEIIPILVKAIQELKAEIDTLKAAK